MEQIEIEWEDTLATMKRIMAKMNARDTRQEAPRAPETTNEVPPGGLQPPKVLDPQIDRWAVRR